MYVVDQACVAGLFLKKMEEEKTTTQELGRHLVLHFIESKDGFRVGKWFERDELDGSNPEGLKAKIKEAEDNLNAMFGTLDEKHTEEMARRLYNNIHAYESKILSEVNDRGSDACVFEKSADGTVCEKCCTMFRSCIQMFCEESQHDLCGKCFNEALETSYNGCPFHTLKNIQSLIKPYEKQQKRSRTEE